MFLKRMKVGLIEIIDCSFVKKPSHPSRSSRRPRVGGAFKFEETFVIVGIVPHQSSRRVYENVLTQRLVYSGI